MGERRSVRGAASSILEYPIAIGAALFVRPQTAQGDGLVKSAPARMAWRAAAVTLMLAGYLAVSIFDVSATVEGEGTQRLVRLAFAVPAPLLLASRRTAVAFAALTAGLLTAAVNVRTGGEVLARERTFFGVHQVSSVQNGAWHVLTHGTTTHGLQATRGRIHSLPTAYYHPSGPLGDVIFTLVPGGRFHDVAVVGLGGGALAAYAGSGVRMDFFEIDEAVIRIAGDPRYFTYLSDAKARPGVTVRTTAADGRLGISAAPAGSLDAIVIDAFSSDAIPTHLITREAMAIYESRLKPHGVIAFHVSSRFFDLPPVLARIAADRGLTGYVRDDDQVPPERAAEGMRASVWVVVARSDADFGQIAHAAPRWVRLAPSPDVALWTDDYSNVLGAMH